MLTQCAIVIRQLPEALELETTRPVACARCEQGKGCGGGIFGLLAGGGRSELLQLPIAQPQRFTPGQRVLLALPGRALLGLAALVYGAPLFAMMFGAWAGQQAGYMMNINVDLNVFPALLGAMISLGLTIGVLAKFAKNLQSRLLLDQLHIVDEAITL